MQADFIEANAASMPDRFAAWFHDTWFTYAQLARRARQLAHRLEGLGIRHGHRIGILAFNHIAHLDLTLAAPKLGFVHVPFNHRLGLEELRVLVARVTPSLMIVDEAHEPLASALGLSILRLSDYEAWLARAPDPPLSARAPVAPDDLHMILFTGGSTGVPKGACLPYRQTLGNARDTVEAWSLTADDSVIQCTPCFHAAVNVLTLPLLLAGGRVLLVPRFEPSVYLDLVAAHAVSLLFMVPTMYRMLADAPAFERADLSGVRAAITGGAPCPPPLQARYAQRGLVLRQGYGMTEAGVNCFRITDEESTKRPGSVGRPMPGLLIQLRREDGSLITQPGETGELTLAGPQVCRGYFGDDDADAAAQGFRDGWLWTGDLAAFDADGLYTIRGRRKDIYISGGENVHPAEIEAALAACADVAECAVFGWPHPHWGECGIAAVVLRPGATADASALLADLRGRIASYKIPADILFLEELPRSAAGKILKPALRLQYEALHPPAHLSAAA